MERDDVFWIELWFDIEKYSQPASCSKQQVEKGWHFFRFLIGMGDTATDTHLWLVPSPLPLLFLPFFLIHASRQKSHLQVQYSSSYTLLPLTFYKDEWVSSKDDAAST